MPVQIKSVKGYYHLDVWVMANIIQLSTTEFCRRFLNKDNDPCGRMFDQMTMAARSTTANIAEGLSRHQTSRETEMKLTDVAAPVCRNCLATFSFSLWQNASNLGQKIRKPTPPSLKSGSTAPIIPTTGSARHTCTSWHKSRNSTRG